MNTWKHVIPTAAIALLAGLAGSTALAQATATSRQSGASDEPTYPSASETRQTTASPADAIPLSDEAVGTASAPTTDMAAPASVQLVPESVTPGPDEPRYVPETGDAQYGPKLSPDHAAPPGTVAPSNRFNDATGQ